MTPPAACPSCRKPLASDAPQGLCPECLLQAGLATGPAGGARRPRRAFTPPAPAELAAHFPQLEILECIGQGGMGAVYRARQVGLGRLVALKILPTQAADDPGFAARFNREARALGQLSHPNIVAVHEFGQAAAYPYFIMEYVDGVTLRQLMTSGRVSPREALAIVPQICDALQFAHDRGVVHRDIKPENILLDRRGAVKIADFGLAKLVDDVADAGITATGDIMGTPHYMAPEQFERPLEVDHRADIFSVGVVFYQMLTGELPLGRFAVPSKKVRIDVRLDEVVLRALEKEPDLRFQQASLLKTELESVHATPAGARVAAGRATDAPRRHPGYARQGVAVLVALGAGLALSPWLPGVGRAVPSEVVATEPILPLPRPALSAATPQRTRVAVPAPAPVAFPAEEPAVSLPEPPPAAPAFASTPAAPAPAVTTPAAPVSGDVLAPLRQSPAILSFESMDSHPDILRLMLHAAERDLVQVRARFAQGLVNQEEMWTAESRVHLLGAKLANDPVRFATLQLQSAERAFARTKALFNMGLQTQQKLDDAETVIGIARLRLDQAGGPQGQ